jgi:aspartate-semialdehyde dehydrogenase
MPDPKHPNGYRVGIVNALTLAGNEVKTVLRERSFPATKVILLDSTGKNSGALTEVDDEPAVVTAISDDELEDLDLVFFGGPGETNREWLLQAEDDDFIAVDLSQPPAAQEGQLVVAGVNLDEIDGGARILVSPHPVAVPITLILHQIEQVARVATCAATVVQPASEFEQAGIEELAQQTIAVLNIKSVPKEVFDRQLAFNLYPAPARNEELIVRQIRALTDPQAEIALLITQGTIFHGHTFSLFIKTEEEIDADRVREALRANTAIEVAEGDAEAGTIDAAGKDEVVVAEVRKEAAIRGGFWIWAASDNLRRSAALNAVLIAEKALLGVGKPN